MSDWEAGFNRRLRIAKCVLYGHVVLYSDGSSTKVTIKCCQVHKGIGPHTTDSCRRIWLRN